MRIYKYAGSNVPLIGTIRVKSFARLSRMGWPVIVTDEYVQAPPPKKLPKNGANIEVIEVSSDDEEISIVETTAKPGRKIGRNNTKWSKTPLQFKNHKIDEFFQKRKIDRKYNCISIAVL